MQNSRSAQKLFAQKDEPKAFLSFCIASRVDNRAGRAGPTVGWAKIGLDQNWPGFFGPKF